MRVDDVTAVIDKNLKGLLATYNHTQPYVMGSRLRLDQGRGSLLYYSSALTEAPTSCPLLSPVVLSYTE
jgi:hypothetical protein